MSDLMSAIAEDEKRYIELCRKYQVEPMFSRAEGCYRQSIDFVHLGELDRLEFESNKKAQN